ncbi:MAG: hypothetical protein PHI18_05025 [bacterium]|nr:hypothetical protein [bacterium]
MPEFLDYLLVILSVAAALAYLIVRKIRKTRRLARDWATGRAERCDSCPVIEIRRRGHG